MALQNIGLGMVTAALVAYASVPKYIGWGTGTGVGVAGTALNAAAPEARVTGTPSQVTTTVANDTYQVTGTITASAARAITEAGLFDAATAGNMFQYGSFAAVNLLTGDSIAFTAKTSFA